MPVKTKYGGDDPGAEIGGGSAYRSEPAAYSQHAKSPEEFVKSRGEEIALNMSDVAITHGGFNKYKPESGRADKHASNTLGH